MSEEKVEITIEELELLLEKKKLEHRHQAKVKTKELKIKERRGYSERLVQSILLACFSIILTASFYAFRYQSPEVWGYVLDVVKYLAPSTVGFFIWKARGENIIKIKDNPSFNLEDYANQVYEEYKDETFNLGRTERY